MRLHGFVSKPEIQKLNRNSIYIFVNGRLIRDRLIQHGLTEAYRNILPPTVYPVVLLFIEMPAAEVDVNVHPSKTEVRFRQQTVMHDFVRDSVRAALMKARPVPQFLAEIKRSRPQARPYSRMRSTMSGDADGGDGLQQLRRAIASAGTADSLCRRRPFRRHGALEFDGGIAVEANAAVSLARDVPDSMSSAFAVRSPVSTMAALRRSRPPHNSADAGVACAR